jgi:hypothetical protein
MCGEPCAGTSAADGPRPARRPTVSDLRWRQPACTRPSSAAHMDRATGRSRPPHMLVAIRREQASRCPARRRIRHRANVSRVTGRPSCPRQTRRLLVRGKSSPDASGCPGGVRVQHRPHPDDGQRRRGRWRLRRCEPDARPGEPGPDQDGGRVPGQRSARTPRRARPAREPPDRNRGAAAHRGHGLRGLLRPCRPARRHAAGSDARERLRVQQPGRLRSGREHRVGHLEPGHAEGDRGRLGALARTPGEHPGRSLQRHRRGRQRASSGIVGERPGRRRLHTGLRGDRHQRSRSL